MVVCQVSEWEVGAPKPYTINENALATAARLWRVRELAVATDGSCFIPKIGETGGD